MPAAVAKTQQPTLAERFKAAHAELVALGEQLDRAGSRLSEGVSS